MKACCLIGLCLLLAGGGIAADWEYYKGLPDDEVAYIQERLTSPENLKDSLMHSLSREHVLIPEEIPFFIKKFTIAEDTLRTVLLEIIHESAKVTKWEEFSFKDPEELMFEKRRVYWSIVWLGYCADETAKEFLMEIAVDDTKDWMCRVVAIDSYLKRADAQQTRDALLRFLTEIRVRPSSTYLSAMMTYEETKGDTAKREAILATLTAIVQAREEDREYFASADKFLAEQSKEYAKSPQRKEALKRMNLPLENKPVENKPTPWKLPLLIGTLVLGGAVVAWCYFKKRKQA
jgi:hypothetical protein